MLLATTHLRGPRFLRKLLFALGTPEQTSKSGAEHVRRHESLDSH